MARASLVAALLVGLVGATPASAGIVYDEAVSGDLSNDGLNPTSISLEVGSNQIFGVYGLENVSDIDPDYFTVTIPAGHQLVALVELAGTQVGSAVAFFAIQAGSQVTLFPSPPDATGLLGWTHFGPTAVDVDILPAIGQGELGATGFVPPLPAGDYALWVQDTGPGNSSYGFDLVVAAVPEPGVAALLLAICASLARARTRCSQG